MQLHKTNPLSHRQNCEISEMRHTTLNLKQRLGESETLRIALESDKLRLSLQNITNSPRSDTATAPRMTSSTPHAIPGTPHATASNFLQSPVSAGRERTGNAHMGTNLSSACHDITEVRNTLDISKSIKSKYKFEDLLCFTVSTKIG